MTSIILYLSDVALRMEDDDVEFGRKEAGQRDGSAQTDGDAHTGDPQRQMTGRTVKQKQIQVNLLMDESKIWYYWMNENLK